MQKGFDVSIVIVNYNGKKYTDVLFDGLTKLKHSDFTYEVVYVDNASSDGSVEYLRDKFGESEINLTIIPGKENLGFAGGNNLGVSKARGKYIVLLNNDTRPESDWLEKLYHYAVSHPEAVMVNSKLVFFYDFIKIGFYTQDKIILKRNIRINDSPYQVDSKFCRNTLCEPDTLVCFGHTEIYLPLMSGNGPHRFEFEAVQSAETDLLIHSDTKIQIRKGESFALSLTDDEAREHRITLIQNAGSGVNEKLDGYDIGFCQEDSKEFSKEYEITNGCGASIIFRRDDFVKCGGFDERFFMYYEDTDLSFRMKKDGRKIMYCPDSVVRHIHAGSSGEWSPFFIFHVAKNKLLFVAKNYGFKKFIKYYSRQLASGLKHKDQSKVKGTQKAFSMVISDRIKRQKQHCPHLIQE